MGFINKFEDVSLTAPKTPLVVTSERFVNEQPVTLLLKEKIRSLSGDDFTIKDLNDVSYFKCKGKTFNFKDKKLVVDLYDTPLFTIKDNKVIALKRKMFVYEGDDTNNVLATVRPQKAFFCRKFTVEFVNKTTGKEETIVVKSDLPGNSCGVFYGEEKEGAPLLCKIYKKIDAKIFINRQNYFVEIAENVDIAFMIAVAICFDELKNDINKYNYG